MLSSSKLFFSALDAFAFLLHYLKLTEVMSCLNNFLLHFLRKLIFKKSSDGMLFSKRGKEKQTVGWYEWNNFKQSIFCCIGLWSLSIKKKINGACICGLWNSYRGTLCEFVINSWSTSKKTFSHNVDAYWLRCV